MQDFNKGKDSGFNTKNFLPFKHNPTNQKNKEDIKFNKNDYEPDLDEFADDF